MLTCRFSLVISVILGVGVAHQSGAQTPLRWSADATIGGATGRGGDYYDNGRTVAHLALAARVRQRDGVTVYFEGGYDWLDFVGPQDAVCRLISGGACQQRFPDIAGPNVSTGVLIAPWTRVEARAGIGAGAFSVDGTVVGSALGQLDAAVFPAAHIGLVFGTRFVVIPRYRGNRLTIIPVLFGLRVR